jgi:hypothetical protein
MQLGKRFLLAAVALGALIAFGAKSALAAPPQSTTVSFQDGGVGHCPGFDFLAQYDVKVSETIFFENNGVPIRRQFHGVARGTLTNLSTNYSIKDAPSVRNGFIDLTTNNETYVGVDFHITVPGSGVVVLQAGRIVFAGGVAPPVFIAGPHQPPPVQAAMICAALSH